VALEIRPARAAELADVGELCVTAYEPFVRGDHHYVAEIAGCLGFERAPERDWSPASGIDLLAFSIAL
jgi:hypothetical protein